MGSFRQFKNRVGDAFEDFAWNSKRIIKKSIPYVLASIPLAAVIAGGVGTITIILKDRAFEKKINEGLSQSNSSLEKDFVEKIEKEGYSNIEIVNFTINRNGKLNALAVGNKEDELDKYLQCNVMIGQEAALNYLSCISKYKADCHQLSSSNIRENEANMTDVYNNVKSKTVDFFTSVDKKAQNTYITKKEDYIESVNDIRDKLNEQDVEIVEIGNVFNIELVTNSCLGYVKLDNYKDLHITYGGGILRPRVEIDEKTYENGFYPVFFDIQSSNNGESVVNISGIEKIRDNVYFNNYDFHVELEKGEDIFDSLSKNYISKVTSSRSGEETVVFTKTGKNAYNIKEKEM